MWSDYDFVNIKGVVDHMFWESRGIELLATESSNLYKNWNLLDSFSPFSHNDGFKIMNFASWVVKNGVLVKKKKKMEYLVIEDYNENINLEREGSTYYHAFRKKKKIGKNSWVYIRQGIKVEMMNLIIPWISGLRLQIGCIPLQVWLAWQILVLGPSRIYPSKHLNLTVWLYWNNHPTRFPLVGDPGSPQLLAESIKHCIK